MRATPLVTSVACARLVTSTVLPLHRRELSNPNPLLLTENGVSFEVEVQVNGQIFYLVPDTGSSDLWVPVADFQCISQEGNEVSQEECHFGNTLEVPETTEYIANQTFGVQYGTGIALGKVGYASVNLNGITIDNATIGFVDRTNDIGDGVGSGILGLGFPPLTSAHPGTELDNRTLIFNRAVYDPVFVSMYKSGLVEPWYSFAIERPPLDATSGPGGWLGLGQLPPVPHSNNWAVKPIEVTESLPDFVTEGVRQITLMTLTVDGVAYSNSTKDAAITNSTSFQAVVDTGNHMNLLPLEIAEAINSAFNPPGFFDEESHVYIVDCNATTPELGFILDGKAFWHDRAYDLIYSDGNGFCYSSVAPTAEGGGLTLNFIGDAFLRNVISVFDFGKEEMRFAARNEPESFTGKAALSRAPSRWFADVALFVALFL